MAISKIFMNLQKITTFIILYYLQQVEFNMIFGEQSLFALHWYGTVINYYYYFRVYTILYICTYTGKNVIFCPWDDCVFFYWNDKNIRINSKLFGTVVPLSIAYYEFSSFLSIDELIEEFSVNLKNIYFIVKSKWGIFSKLTPFL